jgi:tRNA threonylcarbamoyladenosine biosynthesis protein TsaB
MMILAFDTAMAACSVALWRDGDTCAAAHAVMERGHAEQLMPMIAGVLADAHVTAADIDRIAVTRGPGSFTGVRVALSTARGLALPRQIPIVGLTTGEALAAAAVARAQSAGTIVSLIDTKRGDLYAECFDASGAATSAAATVPADDLAAWLGRGNHREPFVLVGDGATLFANDPRFRVLADVVYPDAAVMARLASTRAPQSEVTPLYVQPPKVTLGAS